MNNRVKNLISELRFIYGIKRQSQKKSGEKGWKTQSVKEINRIIRQHQSFSTTTPKRLPKTVVVKGWKTLSAREINRLVRERQRTGE